MNNANWQGRLVDMDREGVDVHLIFPATFSTAASVFDTEMQTELYSRLPPLPVRLLRVGA